MGFVHLQTFSGYSLLNSTMTIEKLVKTAKKKGYSALALTDEQVMYGAVQFYRACKEQGIKPIIGLKQFIDTDSDKKEPLIFLAKGNIGYENLVQLSSETELGSAKALVLSDIKASLTDLTVILPLFESKLKDIILQNQHEQARDYIKRFEALLDDAFFIGVKSPESDEEKRVNAYIKENFDSRQIVAIHNVRYGEKDERLAFECLNAIREGKHWTMESERKNPVNQHLADSNEMEELFEHWPDALANSVKIADACQVELLFNKRSLPKFPVPSEQTATTYLRALCYKAFSKVYPNQNELALKRLQYELKTIEEMGFSDYFLIVWDFMAFSRKQNILTGPGRGSAAGSFVAYLLGITLVNPLSYGLIFERFLNPERISMPDIDIDFPDHRRDEVIQYVNDKYGGEHVAQIITFGTFATRSLLRELIKTMGIDQQEGGYLLNAIPQKTSKSLRDLIQESEDLKSYIKGSQKLSQLFRIAFLLEGLPRHISTHAAGLVISEDPLMKKIPLTEGHDGIALTQFPMNDLEALGLLKMDFLGLRNLTLIERIVQSVHQQEDQIISVNKIPISDKLTFDLLKQGKTAGVFQLESQGMRNVLERLKPSEFEDIVAVNALYRPGPMEFIPLYINRKQGKEPIEYIHPSLEPILKKTYGVLVYQEQIMQVANIMAGFSLGQADILRRAVSKKEKTLIEEQRSTFISGCIANGYQESVADEVYEWIVKFSNYGFNRSHAVAYSFISYQMAYLKAHFPAYFLTELMTSASNQQQKVYSYVKEAEELNITVLPPSINKSFGKFKVESKNHIRFGLSVIKGIGFNVVKEIVRARKNKPYSNLFDFCRRINLKVINRSTIETLILSGSFDETNRNRASLLASIDQAIEQGELFSDFLDQGSLFEDSIELDVNYTVVENFTELKKLSLEKEVLGMYVSSHPLADFREQLRLNNLLSIRDVRVLKGKNNVRGCVVVHEIKTIRTKRGDPMAFLTLGDETGEIDAVIFPTVYRDVNRWISEEMIVIVKGKIEERNGKTQWILNEIGPFKPEELKDKASARIFIKVLLDEQTALTKIKQLAKEYPGQTPIIVHIPQRMKQETIQLSSSYHIQSNSVVLKALHEWFGREHVVLKKDL